MMGSYLLLFFLGWAITIASIWVYFEDKNNDNERGWYLTIACLCYCYSISLMKLFDYG